MQEVSMEIEPDDFGPIFVTPEQIQSWLSPGARAAGQPPGEGGTVVAERVTPSPEGQEPGEAAIPASRDMAPSAVGRPALRSRPPRSRTTTTHGRPLVRM